MSKDTASAQEAAMPATKGIVSSTWSKPLGRPRSIPEEADVVIIGGGIVGVSTAWQLARDGVRVVLCEKGHLACEQSGRNWGWVRQQGRDRREMPMIVDSLNIWRTLADEIGEDVGYREQGVLFAARTEKEFAEYANWLPIAADHGVDTTLLSSSELGALVEGATAKWAGALYTSSDGRAEPHLATPAIARAAKRHGASLISGCAVRGLDMASGRVAGVVTEHGVIRADRVLCAAGAWSSLFCRSLGLSVPQLQLRGTVARLAPGPTALTGALFDRDLAIRRRADGGYTLAHAMVLDHFITPSTFRFCHKFWRAALLEFRGLRLSIGRPFINDWHQPKRWPLDAPSPFEKTRVLNPNPSEKVLGDIRRNTNQLFPALAKTPIVESWAGMIETTPDVVPVIDQPDALPGFYIATGFCGHGFGIGPGAGRAVSQLLQGKDVGYDLGDFRLGRFFDGTPIRPESAV